MKLKLTRPHVVSSNDVDIVGQLYTQRCIEKDPKKLALIYEEIDIIYRRFIQINEFIKIL